MALQDTALRLITKHGRTVQLVKSGSQPENPEKPWRGPADDGVGDVAADDSVKVTCPGFFTSSKEEGIRVLLSEVATDEGDTAGKKRLLVAALSDEGHDLTKFDYVIDGADRWAIAPGSEIIKPGTVAFLYDLQVKQ